MIRVEGEEFKVGRVVLIAVVAVGTGVLPVCAQPVVAGSKDRVELQFGASVLYGTASVPKGAGAYQIGVALWLREQWGLALRYARGFSFTFADSIHYGPPPFHYLHGGDGSYSHTSVTARYRVFLYNGVELSLGMGAQVAGVTDTHLRHRGRPEASDLLTADRPLGAIDELHRETWGPGAVVEMLAGRRLFGRVGVKGGVVFHLGGAPKFEPLVLASVAL